MQPQTLFNVVKDAVDQRQPTYDMIMLLPEKSWSEVCSYFDLGSGIEESIDDQEAEKVVALFVENYQARVNRAAQAQQETDFDLRRAQGALTI